MDARTKRFGVVLSALLLVFSGILGVLGYQHFLRQRAEARLAAHQELSAIADLKLAQIENWRAERLSDARFFSQAHFVAEDIQKVLSGAGSETNRAALTNWLNLLRSNERYFGVVFFDARLERRLAIPESADEPDALLRPLFERARQARDVIFADFHRDQTNGLIHLDLLFPVYGQANSREAEPIAAVLLKLDARRFLFPLIQSWPTPSQTGETLLVRQEGDQVVYLNDLRHRKSSALALRLPLQSPALPAAWALRGETQAIEGIDYRGVPVVAAGRKIPGTPWALISKIDQHEVYTPLRRQNLSMALLLGLLLAVAALLGLLLWRQRNAQFLQRELALADRVSHLMRYANDAILLVSPQGQILEANERALLAYDLTPEEMQKTALRDLRTPETRARLREDLDQLDREGSICFETVHQRKDGSAFPVEVSSRKISIGGESLTLSIVRDITLRKAHELEIERLNRLYAALSQVNQAVVRANSRETLLQEICRVLVDFGGFQMACVVWFDPRRGEFVPAASSGDDSGYLGSIQIFAGNRPEERCPVGTAIRENRACILNRLAEVTSPLPWKEVAARAGWRSLAAFPISAGGDTHGALAVFSQQENYFSAKEESLLKEVAGDVTFGLEALRKEHQRRLAEEALRQSEERFRAIFENAGLGIGEVDEHSVFHVVNDRWCQIVRRPREQFLGLSVHELTYPEDRNTSDRLNADLWAGRIPLISYEKRYLCGDGGFVWVRVTVTTIPNQEGRSLRAIAMVEDITERRRTEEQLRLQAAALQSAANAIVITDRNGTIQWVNAAFERLTGYSSVETVGQTPRVLRSNKQDPMFFKHMWEAILAGRVWRGELVNQRKNGTLYDEEMTITPVADTNGKITHFIAIKLDITERKKAEAALLSARDSLERTVTERTAQLVEANTNLQTFAYTAAHDLRSPLRTIRAFADITLHDYGAQLGTDGQSLIQRIVQSTNAMQTLLNDLLEYSKLSQAEIKLEPTNLNKVVEDALSLLETEIRARNAEIVVGSSLPSVIGHPATLILIMANFVSNGLKFIAPDRQPRISIQAERTDSAFVRISVQDNGIGISSKDLAKLFQVFQRLHGKQAYPGTGLGLAIVRKGAERMGGRVGVESAPGQGSKFWVELPADGGWQ